MIKIALVDDSTLMRTLLVPWINSFENCRIILEAKNGEVFKERLEKTNLPDVLILDLNMPVMGGFETAEWLFKAHIEIKILVLTSLDSDIALIRLLKLGVRGFVRKDDISATELKGAINTLIQTGYYYAGSKLIHVIRKLDGKAPSMSSVSLTVVEMKFLRLACTAMTYRAIAIEMGVSPRTVDGYRESLFSKFDVTTRVEMALLAVKHGIIQI